MSRVRGTDEYRLQITRTTTVEAICLWIGIERDTLLKANPDLETEELEEGQELTVPVAAFEPEQSEEPIILFGEWPPSVMVEAEPTSAAEPLDDAAAQMSQDVESVAIEAEVTDMESLPPLDRTAPAAAPFERDRIEESVSEEDTGYTIPEEPPSTVSWRPFPKSIL